MANVWKACLVCALLFLGGCASDKGTPKETTKEEKQETISLHITIKDEVHNKILFKDEVSVKGDVKTLADFLSKADELQVKMEDGQYGKTIMGMKGVETKDFNKGPWWLYESENNESCKKAGSCDAASSLEIKNGDDFVFKYTSSFQ